MSDDLAVDASVARVLWHRLESINAVTYFSPECRDAPAGLGLEGFWMGYFACRSAPMGPVGPGVVEATFFNFHPARVRRAIPDAWDRATPGTIVEARHEAAAGALRRLLGDAAAEHVANDVTAALGATIERAVPAGRPLFAANAELARPADPVAALWLAATTLREHRGDGHVALLTAAGLDGCEVHALFAACEGVDPGLYQRGRGWSPEDWAAAGDRLAARGMLDAGGAATKAGREQRAEVERRTDELAVLPYEPLGDDGVDRLLDALGPAAERVAGSGEIMFPNPMGLPRSR
jgi:Helix-turn-helix family